ncbi:MAG: 3-hydroxybutyryl-CoA dehydrogenase [Bacteroidetes bacterium]|nr:3-hydroxybutyryl-CoA dehydrogenase [Bacteroidota bacterium]MCW5895030.1 3-hydroxybutyryl-CoA dehydrogenase [Bacteroidota bacterium]
MALKTICIVGDEALVKEYTALASSKGYRCTTTPSKTTTLALELTNISIEDKQKNLRRLDKSLHKNIPILSSSVTVTVAEQNTWIQHPARLIGFGALPTLLHGSLLEFAPSPFTTDAVKAATQAFAESLGKLTSFVHDSVGLVLPRILCSLINEACFALGEGVADRDDIDTAMRLGTNYPDGPVHWGMQIGWRQVHAVVAALHRHFGDERYRAAPVLKRASFQGMT